MLALLLSAAALLQSSTLLRPLRLDRCTSVALAEVESTEPEASWPQPASTVAELQQAQAKAKELAEQEALANPTPFRTEEGGFSVVALTTLAVFVLGGSIFFQGITGGGAARFVADQSPEVQACLQQATTRTEASECLPPVPLE